MPIALAINLAIVTPPLFPPSEAMAGDNETEARDFKPTEGNIRTMKAFNAAMLRSGRTTKRHNAKPQGNTATTFRDSAKQSRHTVTMFRSTEALSRNTEPETRDPITKSREAEAL